MPFSFSRQHAGQNPRAINPAMHRNHPRQKPAPQIPVPQQSQLTQHTLKRP